MKYILSVIFFILFMVSVVNESSGEVCVNLETSVSVILNEVSPKIKEYAKTWTIETDNQLFADNVMKIIEERVKNISLLNRIQVNVFFNISPEGKVIFILQTIFFLYDLNEMINQEDFLNVIFVKNFILLVKEYEPENSNNSKVGI